MIGIKNKSSKAVVNAATLIFCQIFLIFVRKNVKNRKSGHKSRSEIKLNNQLLSVLRGNKVRRNRTRSPRRKTMLRREKNKFLLRILFVKPCFRVANRVVNLIAKKGIDILSGYKEKRLNVPYTILDKNVEKISGFQCILMFKHSLLMYFGNNLPPSPRINVE